MNMFKAATKAISFWKGNAGVLWEHFKFFLSRQISFPLVNPDMLQLCFLFRCNLNCKMCNIRQREKIVKSSGLSHELPFKTIINLIGQAKEMRIKQLFLLGGEPFLRKDLFDVIKYAGSLKLKTVVSTNGTLLGDPGIAESIFDAKLDVLLVSIDGACEGTFKKIRGEGIFEKVLANIKLLNEMKKCRKSASPDIIFLCTIMGQNIEELLDVVLLARELGVSGVCFQPVVTDNTDTRLRDDADPNWVPQGKYGILDRSVDALIKYKFLSQNNFKFIFTGVKQLQLVKKYFRGTLLQQPCYAGFNRIIISQDGKMYFCAEDPDNGKVSFGDIYKDSLGKLWYSPQARIFRKSIKKCERSCLLGCSRRDTFDRLRDNLTWNFYERRQ